MSWIFSIMHPIVRFRYIYKALYKKQIGLRSSVFSAAPLLFCSQYSTL